MHTPRQGRATRPGGGSCQTAVNTPAPWRVPATAPSAHRQGHPATGHGLSPPATAVRPWLAGAGPVGAGAVAPTPLRQSRQKSRKQALNQASAGTK